MTVWIRLPICYFIAMGATSVIKHWHYLHQKFQLILLQLISLINMYLLQLISVIIFSGRNWLFEWQLGRRGAQPHAERVDLAPAWLVRAGDVQPRDTVLVRARDGRPRVCVATSRIRPSLGQMCAPFLQLRTNGCHFCYCTSEKRHLGKKKKKEESL